MRHVSPRLIGVIEFLDDMLYKITHLFSREKEITDLSEEPAKKKRLLVHRALHKVRRKPVEQIVEPCPGIYALLNLLRNNDITMGLVSNGLGKGYGHDILEKFNLKDYFKTEIFREDIQKSKPHPDPIMRAIRELQDDCSSEQVIWYIGDRHKDITASLAADKLMDCKIVPLSYGLNAAMAILQNNVGADHIILNYFDFISRIRPLLKNQSVYSENTSDINQRNASKSVP